MGISLLLISRIEGIIHILHFFEILRQKGVLIIISFSLGGKIFNHTNNPGLSEIAERFRFHNREQREDETVNAFLVLQNYDVWQQIVTL